MLATVVAAVLCGARGVTAIVQWLHAQEPVVWHALGYYRRPPKVKAFAAAGSAGSESGCVLGQTSVGSTNEVKAAVELIRRQVLPGQVVTGDAMFCQREVCQAVVDQGADYLLVVKDNQRELKEAIVAEFTEAVSPWGEKVRHAVQKVTWQRSYRHGRGV